VGGLVAIGFSDADVLNLASAVLGIPSISAEKTVLPGFIDAHSHRALAGGFLTLLLFVLPICRSIAAMQAADAGALGEDTSGRFFLLFFHSY